MQKVKQKINALVSLVLIFTNKFKDYENECIVHLKSCVEFSF
jgi:hypothetical protein